jgi:hypothetical protein
VLRPLMDRPMGRGSDLSPLRGLDLWVDASPVARGIGCAIRGSWLPTTGLQSVPTCTMTSRSDRATSERPVILQVTHGMEDDKYWVVEQVDDGRSKRRDASSMRASALG